MNYDDIIMAMRILERSREGSLPVRELKGQEQGRRKEERLITAKKIVKLLSRLNIVWIHVETSFNLCFVGVVHFGRLHLTVCTAIYTSCFRAHHMLVDEAERGDVPFRSVPSRPVPYVFVTFHPSPTKRLEPTLNNCNLMRQ